MNLLRTAHGASGLGNPTGIAFGPNKALADREADRRRPRRRNPNRHTQNRNDVLHPGLSQRHGHKSSLSTTIRHRPRKPSGSMILCRRARGPGQTEPTRGIGQRGCLGRQHTFRNELRCVRWSSYLGFFRKDKSMSTVFIGLARNAARP